LETPLADGIALARQTGRTSYACIFLVIALQRFDALTRDDRNHEDCGYRIRPPPSKKRVEN
jgi:hypothetical protein